MTVTLPVAASVTPTQTTDFTTALSQIRMRTGDTGGLNGTGRVYLSDDHINAVYVINPSVLGASIECVKNILSLIARDADFSAGAISTTRSVVFSQFKDTLALLEQEQGSSVTAFVGGQSYAEARVIASSSDTIPRAFSIGMDTNY